MGMLVAFTAGGATAVADSESGTPSSGLSIIACPALYALGIRLVDESPTSAAILPNVSMRAAAPLPGLIYKPPVVCASRTARDSEFDSGTTAFVREVGMCGRGVSVRAHEAGVCAHEAGIRWREAGVRAHETGVRGRAAVHAAEVRPRQVRGVACAVGASIRDVDDKRAIDPADRAVAGFGDRTRNSGAPRYAASGRARGSATRPMTPRHGIGPARNVTTRSESTASRCAAAHLAVLASIAEDHRIPAAISGPATANPITSPQLSGSQLVGAITQLPEPQTAAVTATEKFTGGVAAQGNGNPPTSVFSPRSGASSTPNSSGTGQFPFGTGAIMITVPADRPGTDNTYPFSTN
ncbi:hypothetical protein [Nocardia sp. JCM 34519.1]|uniref:hypothetical protein n=2 Tax=unclassified Nocardia TaxID=2637762 RepID=UPI001CE49DEA|nr:hypothetical protein [Nocardia sp. JCM 34519.1]